MLDRTQDDAAFEEESERGDILAADDKLDNKFRKRRQVDPVRHTVQMVLFRTTISIKVNDQHCVSFMFA